jgi:tRNA uridine 5-carboxymethylaminomethyl modification enzyme
MPNDYTVACYYFGNYHQDARNAQVHGPGWTEWELVKRAELGYDAVENLAPAPEPLAASAARQVEIEVKYEGYIQKQVKEIEKFKHLEKIRIPDDFDFRTVHGLSNELKNKLADVRPTCLGQSARIDGITPAALSVLMVALKARGR